MPVTPRKKQQNQNDGYAVNGSARRGDRRILFDTVRRLQIIRKHGARQIHENVHADRNKNKLIIRIRGEYAAERGNQRAHRQLHQ